ncbi:MAG: ornithine cyclodeaminase [Deltaproteobacteria bacterium]|nr:ornithine cyclodeaminase [Deltaproteobacteria bacterium]
MLVLTRQDLEALLTMEEVIDAVEAGFRQYAEGGCRVPLRLGLEVPEHAGSLLLMPSYTRAPEALGTKMVSIYTENPARGLPTVLAAYLLNDPATGELLALTDATFLTGIRTGATSGVATRHLARRPVRQVGIFGSGVQARYQLWAMAALYRLERALVYSIDRAGAEAFAREMQARFGLAVTVAASPAACLGEADVIITATTSSRPVFSGAELGPGVHINAIGAYTPEMQELDEATVKRARVVVDTYEGALAEAGDLLVPLRQGAISRDHILADLGEVVSGRRRVRESPEQVTIFKSVGCAIEDLVTARLGYEKALAQGRGQEVRLG